MINKKNRLLLQELKGEYFEFAKELIARINEKCLINKATQDEITEILLMLKEGNSEGKPFKDVVPNKESFFHEVLKSFPNKNRYFNKISFLSMGISLAVIFLVVYFTNLSPVRLQEPKLTYDKEYGYVAWNNIPNATQYEIYINDELFSYSNYTMFDVSKAKSYGYRLTVKAVGQGRYKPASSTIDVTIDPSKHVIDSEDYSGGWYHIDLPQYRGFLRKQIEFDILGKAIVTYTPEYNAYLLTTVEDCTLHSLKADGEPIEITEYMWFYEGIEYQFEFKKNPTGSHPALDLRIRQFDKEMIWEIPKGETVFVSNPKEQDIWKCYESANQAFSFAYLENITDEPVFYQEFFSNRLSYGFIVINNSSEETQTLTLEVEEIQLTESGTITIGRGYTNILLPDISDEIKPFWETIFCFYSNQKVIVYDGFENSSRTQILREKPDEFSALFRDLEYGYYTSNKNMILFNESSEEVTLEYGILSNKVDITDEDFFLPFGISILFVDATPYQIHTSKPIYINSGYYGEPANDTWDLSAKSFCIFFNPYKEDVFVQTTARQ